MNNYYYQELNWVSDFSHTGETFKRWCVEEKGNHRYFQMHVDRICDEFEIYKNLRDTLKKHDLILYKCKFMQMDPGVFMKIHVDQGVARVDISEDDLVYYSETRAIKYIEVSSPVEVALNIPLLNTEHHITRWFRHDDCDVNIKGAACGPQPMLDLSKWPNKDKLVEERCVASFRMSKPSLIRTNELHNVDARHSDKTRWILSTRLTDAHTGEFLSWNELNRVHNIKF
jgi:hypothetical protein